MAGSYDGSLKFDTEISEKGFNSGITKLGSLAKGGFKVLSAAVAGVTASLGAASGAVIKIGSDFESQMSRVKAISGATGEEFEQLRQQAIDLGADTAFSASEAANGMENLAAAGFSTNEIMSAMPGMLDLAAASGEDLASSADIAASTLRGFGLEASEAGHVADVLAENANRTNSSVAETGEAMKYIAPLARAAGISMEETAAAIGIMANAGIQGSQAGTTLRGALSRLSAPTDDMIQAMDELGVSFYDSEGKMLSLSDQVGMLQTAMSGLTDEQKNNYLVTLYGQESLSGMLALINEGPDSLSQLTQSFQACDGAAEKAASTMQDNLQGAVEQLKGSAETLGITIYDSVSDGLKGLAQLGTDAINQLTSAFQEQGFDGLIQVGSQIIANVLTGISQGVPGAIALALQIITSILSGLTENMPQIISAGGQILRSLITGMIQLLPQIGLFVLTLIQELYTQISAAAPGLLQKGYELLSNIVDGFVQAIPEALPKILDFIQGIGQQLAAAAPVMIQKGFELLSKLVEGIVSAVPILISRVPEIISTFANIINDNFPIILAKGAELLGQLALGLIQAIPTLVANIPQIISAIVDVITAFNWLNLGKTIITGLGNGIKSMVGFAKNAGTSIFNGIKSTIQNLPGTLANLGKSAIYSLSSTISGLASSARTAALKIASSIESALLSLPSKMLSIGKNIVQGLWNGISDMTGWIIDKIQGFGSSVLDGIKDFFGIKSPSRLMRDEVGKYLAQGVGVGFELNMPTDDMIKSADAAVQRMRKATASVTGASSKSSRTVGGMKNNPVDNPREEIDYDRLERIQRKVAKEQSKRPIYLGTDRIDKPLPKGAVPRLT